MTEDQILDAIKEELISSYGSLSNGDLPYTVLGIVNCALRKIKCDTKNTKVTDWKIKRIKARLSIREVAAKTGFSNPYISQLESGKIKSPSFKVIDTLTKLYDGLNIE